jgi:hypothetical protein
MSSTASASDTSSDNDQATPPGPPQQETLVTNWLARLDLDADMAPGSVTGSTTGNNNSNGMKVGAPKEFTGAATQVKQFILQCRIVFNMDSEKFGTHHRRLLYIVSYMKGPAFDFIQPHLEDYLEHIGKAEDRKDSTNRIFRTDDSMFNEIRSTFGQMNEQQEAERALLKIHQQSSAAKYKAEFQSLSARVSWNDEALAAQFYQGLKDAVKDEIARQDRPKSLSSMIELAIKIDTRIWERQMERKGKGMPHGANTSNKRDTSKWRNDYYGPQPMELDATRGKPGKPQSRGKGKPYGKGQGNKERKPFDKSNLECHSCGKKGHFARECSARKQSHELRKPEHARATKNETATIAATRIPDHAEMTWTMCCDNDCRIHLSDKEGSGWFPRTSKAQSVCVLRAAGPPVYATEPEDEDEYEIVGSDPGMSEEASEEEDITTVRHWDMPSSDVGMEILTMLHTQWAQAAPWVHGVQHVHQFYFDLLMEGIRRKMRVLPPMPGPVNYGSIVQEVVPFGSEFTPRGGYFTREGINVPRSLRQEVTELRRRYIEEAEDQRRQNRIIPLSSRLRRDGPDQLQTRGLETAVAGFMPGDFVVPPPGQEVLVPGNPTLSPTQRRRPSGNDTSRRK